MNLRRESLLIDVMLFLLWLDLALFDWSLRISDLVILLLLRHWFTFVRVISLLDFLCVLSRIVAWNRDRPTNLSLSSRLH